MLLSVPIFLVFSLLESIGAPLFFLCLILIAGIIIWFKKKLREERIAELTEKYKDQDVVEKIMNRMFWQGQTEEQLIDSLQKPLDIDEKVLKSKRREVWKYNRDGVNRYRLRITLENGIVVGWKQR